LFGAVMFFFVIFFTVIQQNIRDKNDEKEIIVLQNLALNVQDEIGFAAESSNGYSRTFYVEKNILGKDYYINVTGDLLYVGLGDLLVSYGIPYVEGVIQKGDNTIRKDNGAIYLN
ncbi:MAG: hypothetical protein KKB31_04765, partial [Nanoarchaeota archaeon]|nr:hypothetical protein [Nanoarchaeota archaeon]